MTDVVVNAMTRVVDPGYDHAETEDEKKAAAATEDPSRLTFHVPTHATVFSLGNATEEDRWANWQGTWGGIMGATQRDLWLASSGACIIAGYVGEEQPSLKEVVGGKGVLTGMTVGKVDKARKTAEYSVRIGEVVLGCLGLADWALYRTPGFFGYLSGVLALSKVGLGIWKVAATRGKEGKIHEGDIQLHGANEVLLSSPRVVRTAAALQNSVIGGLSAELVGGWSAGVHGIRLAELAAYYSVQVKALGKVGITCDRRVDISSRTGTVQVQGSAVEIGKTFKLPRRQKETKTVEVSAADEVVLNAGPDGDARLELHGGGGKAVLETGNSGLNFEEGKCHALVGHSGLRLTEDELSLVYVSAPPDVGDLIKKADDTCEAAKADAETTFKAAETVIDKYVLTAAGAAAAFPAAGVGVRVGASVGGPGVGKEGLAGLGAGFAGGAALATGGTALAMYCKQHCAARQVADKAIEAAKKARQTAIEAAHKANTLAVDAAAALPTAPRVTVKSDSVLVGIGAAQIEVKANAVTIDGSPAGTVTLKAGGSQVKLGPRSVELDGGPNGTVTLKVGSNKCTLSADGWEKL